ncbi:MAG TPA: von Willebrand factor type A domain-containing protein [Gemmatimonadales bacterium]|nr:von Willebrand factor type A domain-containing protein [Gemmatimonadales bacterium]
MSILNLRTLGLVPALLLFAPTARPATLPAAGALAGTVRDAAGAGIPSARVRIVGSTMHAVADSGGRYRIERVPEGAHALEVSARGFRTSPPTRVLVRSGGTTVADFTLERVTDERDAVAAAPEAAALGQQRADAARSDEVRSAAAPRAEHGRPTGHAPGGYRRQREPGNTEEYGRIYDNRYFAARNAPLSTFSIDVDRASYSNVRRFIMQGQLPPADAVRTEELINYFPYEYPEPSGQHPFGITADLGPAPWNPSHRLARIALQGRREAARELPPSNLVFLVDVSGSMASENKLPLVKQSLRALVRRLRPEDRVAIVVYAGSAGLVLPSTAGSVKHEILAALGRLEAGGSTAGGAGIRLAYEVARRHFIPGGNNRVILATDGDFNVGVSSEGELVRLIEEKRTEGTYLTVLGFGTGNYKDRRMEQLADHGNGNYAYIDNLMEAEKVFGTELTATLFTIAKDVKIQVEFNPARVRGYRLIGYENRLLAAEDFNDDRKDAGELGAGHTVTALYEIVPVDAESDAPLGDVDELRYQPAPEAASGRPDEWLTVKVRYKLPESERSRLLVRTVRDRDARTRLAGDFAFAASLAAFGMVLRDSEHRGSATFDQVLRLAREGRGVDTYGYRAEFIRLVEMAQSMALATRGE